MNNSNLNSVKNTVSSWKPLKAVRLLVVAFFVLAQTVVFGATITSTAKGGNWSDKSTWVGGVVPESSDNVIIATGATVTMISATVTIKTFTIYGQLVLLQDVSHVVNTTSLVVVSPSGTILFDKKSDIKLPSNTPFQVNLGGLIGACSNNNSIFLGNIEIAVCNGPGNTMLTFEKVMENGGYNIVSISPTSASACGSGSFSFTATAIPSSAATIKWYTAATGGTLLETGVSGSSSTYTTPTPISTTTTYYADATIGAFTTPRKAVIATVNQAPSAPKAETITDPNCAITTGSVVLNGLPASGTWTLTRYPGGIVTTGTGSSTTISNLASGTYTFTVSNGTCTSIASNDVVINASTNTWNVVSGVGSWTNTLTNSQAITFNGDYNSTGDLTACSCNVNTGKKVTIKSGHNLIITNGVTVSETGTLIFEDSASLVQTNNTAVNSGNITYKRYTSIRSTDYTYWSSPVASYTLGGVSQNKTLSDKYYSFNSTIDNWQQESAATVMNPGVGYIVRGPELKSTSNLPPPPVGLFEASFIGVPNNGNKSITNIIANKSYLLGNPYPSAIDADDFLIANKDVLNGTLYFWTNNTEIGTNVSNPGTGVFAYSSDDYATYNATGGVGAADPDLDPKTGKPYPEASPSGSAKPNGKIAAGQGFFASSKTSLSGTSIVFNNDMRVIGTTSTEGIGANQQFFKTKNTKSKATTLIEKNRIWLNLKNNQGAFKQTLIGYITDATNKYDSSFDGESFDGNEFIDFYSINQEKNLVIQGRALPFDENDEVPLGFRSTIEGDFTIIIDETDGLLTNQPVFLEDKLTNKVFDLKSGNYTFNTVAGTFDDRFVLRYTNKTLSVDETDKEDGILVFYSNNYKTLIIHNNDMYSTVNSVALFNITGQNIANWEVSDSEQTNIQIPIKTTSSGIYIVKVKTTKGESSKKIIIR